MGWRFQLQSGAPPAPACAGRASRQDRRTPNEIGEDMPITITLSPLNVDSSANNFVYAIATLAFSGNYPTGGDHSDFSTLAPETTSHPHPPTLPRKPNTK